MQAAEIEQHVGNDTVDSYLVILPYHSEVCGLRCLQLHVHTAALCFCLMGDTHQTGVCRGGNGKIKYSQHHPQAETDAMSPNEKAMLGKPKPNNLVYLSLCRFGVFFLNLRAQTLKRALNAAFLVQAQKGHRLTDESFACVLF